MKRTSMRERSLQHDRIIKESADVFENKAFASVDEIGPPKGPSFVKLAKQLVEEATVCRLWLANRRPTQWRDRQAMKHVGGLTLEQLLE